MCDDTWPGSASCLSQSCSNKALGCVLSSINRSPRNDGTAPNALYEEWAVAPGNPYLVLAQRFPDEGRNASLAMEEE